MSDDNSHLEQAGQLNKTVQYHATNGLGGLFGGLFTAALGAVCGAYLALFALSRPDVFEKAGIGRFMPATEMVNPTEVKAIEARIVRMETAIAQLPTNVANAPLSANGSANNSGALTPIAPNAPTNGAPAVPNISSDVATMSGRLNAIETRLAGLDPSGVGGALIAQIQADLAALKVKVANLEASAPTAASPQASMAMLALAEKSRSSAGFMAEISGLEAQLANWPAAKAVLTRLTQYAQTGAPSRETLYEDLSGLEASLDGSLRPARTEGGIVGWFRQLLAGMVKVRPIEQEGKDTPHALFASAKVKWSAGDLTGAVADITALPNKSPDFVHWLEVAHNRVAIDENVEILRGMIAAGPPKTAVATPAQTGIIAEPSPTDAPNAQEVTP